MKNFLRSLFLGEKRKKETERRFEPRAGYDSLGAGPTVRCKKMGHFYDFEWTYKENGVIDRPRCMGCGKLFNYDGDDEHTVFSVT